MFSHKFASDSHDGDNGARRPGENLMPEVALAAEQLMRTPGCEFPSGPEDRSGLHQRPNTLGQAALSTAMHRHLQNRGGPYIQAASRCAFCTESLSVTDVAISLC